MITLGSLADALGLALGDADPETELTGIAPLHKATSDQLAFITEAKYLDSLRATNAACVILREDWIGDCSVPYLVAKNPYFAYARATQHFEKRMSPSIGVHPSAVIHEDAIVQDEVSIGPNVCIEAGAQLARGAIIGAGCYIGERACIGAGTRLEPNVTLYHDVVLGDSCSVHSGSVLGADGFGFARHAQGWQKITQLGGVRIGDRVDIGALVTIDRGALDDTVIGDDVIIDDHVHLAHNCVIGNRTAIAGCVGFAGSVEVGEDCTFAGQAGVSGHLKICDNAHFTGQARVAKAITEPGTYASGTQVEPQRQWARNAVRFTQLDAMQRRIQDLEKKLAAQGGDDNNNS